MIYFCCLIICSAAGGNTVEYGSFLTYITENGNTTEKIFERAFGIPKEKICENAVISPGWNPGRVFGMDRGEKIAKSSPLFGFKVWNIPCGNSKITYVKTGYGASVVLDAVLLLGMTECKNILFLSSVGALSEKFGIGDILIPRYCVCGDGASRYISSERDLADVFGEKTYPNSGAFKRLAAVTENCCRSASVKCHFGETFCADTIAAQGGYIEKMIKHGCNSVDMESAAFFGSAKAAGISAAALMQVSDNVLLKKSLFSDNICEEEKAYRRYVRAEVLPEIIKKYFNEVVF